MLARCDGRPRETRIGGPPGSFRWRLCCPALALALAVLPACSAEPEAVPDPDLVAASRPLGPEERPGDVEVVAVPSPGEVAAEGRKDWPEAAHGTYVECSDLLHRKAFDQAVTRMQDVADRSRDGSVRAVAVACRAAARANSGNYDQVAADVEEARNLLASLPPQARNDSTTMLVQTALFVVAADAPAPRTPEPAPAAPQGDDVSGGGSGPGNETQDSTPQDDGTGGTDTASDDSDADSEKKLLALAYAMIEDLDPPPDFTEIVREQALAFGACVGEGGDEDACAQEMLRTTTSVPLEDAALLTASIPAFDRARASGGGEGQVPTTGTSGTTTGGSGTPNGGDATEGAPSTGSTNGGEGTSSPGGASVAVSPTASGAGQPPSTGTPPTTDDGGGGNGNGSASATSSAGATANNGSSGSTGGGGSGSSGSTGGGSGGAGSSGGSDDGSDGGGTGNSGSGGGGGALNGGDGN